MCAWPMALIRCAEGTAGDGEHLGEFGACCGGGCVHILEVDRVQRLVDRAQQFPAPGAVDRQFGHQLAEDLEVHDEVPHLRVEHGQVHPRDPVLRLVAGRAHVAELGRQEGVVVEDGGVGRGLDVQLDLLAARRLVGHAHPLVVRVDALHRGAVGPVDQALALESGLVGVEAEVEQRLHGPARPLGRDGAAHGDPAGPPGHSPGVAHGQRLPGRYQALGDRHGFAGGVPDADLQRDGLGVDRRDDALDQDARESGFDETAVIVHGAAAPRSGWVSNRRRRIGIAGQYRSNQLPARSSRVITSVIARAARCASSAARPASSTAGRVPCAARFM
jgi:hypothetical protein